MSRDRAIAAIAARQHGVVTRGQLLAAGISRQAIQHRLSQRRLHPLHRGVYLVGHPVSPPLASEMAAVLACGEGSVISHETAAAIHGFRSSGEGPIDVTVLSRSRRPRPGIRTHTTGTFEPGDVRRHHGIPITSPARTFLDLAAGLRPNELRRALEDAQVRRVVTASTIRLRLERSPHRPGAPLLLSLLDGTPLLTRSEAEARLVELVRAADLGPSASKTRIGRHEVDFLWRRERLIVEVDGFTYHGSRAAFERDGVRDAELQAAGYRVMRITWTEIESRPEAVIARLAQALALSRLGPAVGEERGEPQLQSAYGRQARA
jgi:very-short-patch-repair endonuclease